MSAGSHRPGPPQRAVAGMVGAQAAAADLRRARGEQAESVELDPVFAASALELFGAAEKLFKARRMYGPDAPAVQRFGDELYQRATEHLEQFGALRVAVTPRGATVDGVAVHDAGANAGDNMWFVLFRDGVRDVTFLAGVERDELVGLFAALAELATQPPDGEDDAISALWALDLQHVAHTARELVLTTAERQGGTRARVERVQALVAASAVQTGPPRAARTLPLAEADLSFLERENLASLERVPPEVVRARGDVFVLDGWERTLLIDELESDAWGERFLDAVTSTLGHDAVVELVAERARDADAAVRAAALRSLAVLDPHELGPARAKAALHDSDARVRRAALEALEALSPNGAAEWIAAAIASERFAERARDEKVAWFRAHAIIGGDPAAAELLERLEHRNVLGRGAVDDERAAAALALGALGYSRARPALARLAEARMTRAGLREACAEAVRAIDSARRARRASAPPPIAATQPPSPSPSPPSPSPPPAAPTSPRAVARESLSFHISTGGGSPEAPFDAGEARRREPRITGPSRLTRKDPADD